MDTVANEIKRFVKGSPMLYSTAKAISNFPRAATTEMRCWPIWLRGKVQEVQGSKMYLDVYEKDRSLRRTFRAYAINRVHEEATTRLFKTLVRRGDVVLDLGANLGYFTMLAARQVGPEGRVYAFEPEPRNYACLRRNLDLNGYSNVIARQCAVADKPGFVKLFICPYDTGHHTIRSYDGIAAYRPDYVDRKKASVDVEQVRLDSLLEGREQHVDVIKMDVEGAEALALDGMQGVLTRSPNLVMVVEFFPLLIKNMGHSPDEFVRRLLDEFGFAMWVVEEDYCMSGQSVTEGLLRVHSVDQLMGLCKGTSDHLNLILEKSDSHESRL